MGFGVAADAKALQMALGWHALVVDALISDTYQDAPIV
jgi:hypothetical protein